LKKNIYEVVIAITPPNKPTNVSHNTCDADDDVEEEE
jgi:hypothetical protein